MNFFEHVFQDWSANTGNSKGKVVLVLFRIANYARNGGVAKLLLLPYLIFYKFFVEWVMTIEIPYQTEIGKNFRLFHGQGTVLHKNTLIGNNVTIRQNTTVGNAKTGGGYPVIEDNVNLGAHSILLGNITIGENSVIGAGSVVVKSIPANSIAVGNPAKVVRETVQVI